MSNARAEARPEQTAPRAVVSAWEVKSTPFGRFGSGWPELVAAMACWPGGPVSVERRFVSHARTKAARQYILASAEGSGLLAGAGALRGELETLTAGVRRMARHRAITGQPARGRPTKLRSTCDCMWPTSRSN